MIVVEVILRIFRIAILLFLLTIIIILFLLHILPIIFFLLLFLLIFLLVKFVDQILLLLLLLLTILHLLLIFHLALLPIALTLLLPLLLRHLTEVLVFYLFYDAVDGEYEVEDEKEEDDSLYEYGEEIVGAGHSGGRGEGGGIGYAFVGGSEERVEGEAEHSSNVSNIYDGSYCYFAYLN